MSEDDEIRLDNRIIYVDGEIDDEKAKDVIDQLLRLDIQSPKDITMYINSNGGAVSSGLAIYDTMNMIKSDVSTLVSVFQSPVYY